MIEKMKRLHLVGHQLDMDLLLKEIIISGVVHPLDAMTEIDQSRFKIPMDAANHAEIVNMCAIGPMDTPMDFTDIEIKVNQLMERLEIPHEINHDHYKDDISYQTLENNVTIVYNKFEDLNKKIDALVEEYDELERFTCIDCMKGVMFNLSQLEKLDLFDVRLGTLRLEDKKRLSMNYENITAAVLHIGQHDMEEVYLIVSPKKLAMETDRILRSVFFKDIPILWQYMDYPEVALQKINERLFEINIELSQHKLELERFKENFGGAVAMCFSLLRLHQALLLIRPKIACTAQYFYFSGWAPETDGQALTEKLQAYGERVIVSLSDLKEMEDDKVPPTKLSNHRFFKPFETLVLMYGVPSYDEFDPTGFVGMTYMLLFGAMFGDLGQGFVFWLLGFVLGRLKPNQMLSGVISRIGLSSMAFGVVYDSVFGVEHVLSGLAIKGFGQSADLFFLRPIEHANLMLILSIALGLVLLIMSYGLGIYNKLRMKDFKEGWFGRNGINGLVLFLGLLSLGGVMYFEGPNWVERLSVSVIALSVMLLLFREPLTQLILNKRPLHHEAPSAYYTESTFELLETFLSLLSNGISFIRVGAFALNHVGLFIAFHTMADIIGTAAGSVLMFILGNVLILALEGLIVFIQGLRLIYYELFSKYYVGEGIQFEGIQVKAMKRGAK